MLLHGDPVWYDNSDKTLVKTMLHVQAKLRHKYRITITLTACDPFDPEKRLRCGSMT